MCESALSKNFLQAAMIGDMKKDVDNGVNENFPLKFSEDFRRWLKWNQEFCYRYEDSSKEQLEEAKNLMASATEEIFEYLLHFIACLLMAWIYRSEKDIALLPKEDFQNFFFLYKKFFCNKDQNENSKRENRKKQIELIATLINIYYKLGGDRSQFSLGSNEGKSESCQNNGDALFLNLHINMLFFLNSLMNMDQKRSMEEIDWRNYFYLIEGLIVRLIKAMILPIVERYLIVDIKKITYKGSFFQLEGIDIRSSVMAGKVKFCVQKNTEFEEFYDEDNDGNLFLINKEKLKNPYADRYNCFSRDDYLCLTPFMVSATSSSPKDAMDLLSAPKNELGLLDYKDEQTVPYRFVSEVSKLSSRVEKFLSEIQLFHTWMEEAKQSGSEINSLSVSELQEKMWRISSNSVQSLVDINRYNNKGEYKNSNQRRMSGTRKYIEELFVYPEGWEKSSR